MRKSKTVNKMGGKLLRRKLRRAAESERSSSEDKGGEYQLFGTRIRATIEALRGKARKTA